MKTISHEQSTLVNSCDRPLLDEKQLVEEYYASGLSTRNFALQHAISNNRLKYLVYDKYRSLGPPKKIIAKTHFQELTLPHYAVGNTKQWAAEIQWPSGACIRIAEDADPQWIGCLLKQVNVL